MIAPFKTREEFIIYLMNLGCENSAISLSRFFDSPVTISGKQSILIHSTDKFSYVNHEGGIHTVLSTQMIGAVAGTSFLILSEPERETILSSITKWGIADANDQLKDSMLSEIANIISASAIAELSNALQLEIYGDVPVIRKLNGHELQVLVAGELIDKHDRQRVIPSSLIVLSNLFTIDLNVRIHPQFLWKLDSRILEKIAGTEFNSIRS